MRIAIGIAVSVVGAASLAHSAAAADAQQFCNGGGIFIVSREAGEKSLQKCKPGDLVSIPADETSAVARYCDLTKAPLASGQKVICTLRATPLGLRDVVRD